MVMAWEDDARAVLREAGHAVPSRLATRGRRMVSRAWLGVQKSLNLGVGARINTLEAGAYTRPLLSSISVTRKHPTHPKHPLNTGYTTPTRTPYPIQSAHVELRSGRV